MGKTETNAETGITEKPLSPEEKLLGTYEAMVDGNFVQLVLLENGKVDICEGDEGDVQKNHQVAEGTWKMAGQEVHLTVSRLFAGVWRIESDGDLTQVGYIDDGKRADYPIDLQKTWKKLK